MSKRLATVFIDGFNLYHSIASNPRYRKYKWLDLWTMCERLLLPNDILTNVLYFSAYAYWNPEKVARHHIYTTVNEARGCTVVLGRFQEKTRYSNVSCGHPCFVSVPEDQRPELCRKKYISHEEKLTDVNIAVNIIKTCVQGACDVVYLLSGDNDLVPALETAKELCPNIRIRVILPPNAKAKRLMGICDEKKFHFIRIREKHLQSCQLPDNITISGQTFTRPESWK